MQINSINSNYHASKTHYTPNFERKLKLPTIDVIGCITGGIKENSDKNTLSMVKTIAKIFNLKPNNLAQISQTPLAFDICIIGAGNMLKKENQNLENIANILIKLPKEEQILKINEIIQDVGETINVIL